MVGPSSGSSWQIVLTLIIHAWNHHYKTVNAVSSSGVVVTHTLERALLLNLGIPVTEINTKKTRK